MDPRILFAAERTLLAWNRTSIALIAFGFLIERSGLLLAVLNPESVNLASTYFTHLCGLGFILLGVVSAMYSVKQYIATLKTLSSIDIPNGYNAKSCVAINVVISIMGLVLIVGIFIGH